ncbi:hypothetical protein RB195_018946 [Necator americanus]|uniref:Reverse transcriptase domain-containing protein n=1 Tax=Necator americanus TaxID=51031 RepID=A0ABR1CD01_NECAM
MKKIIRSISMDERIPDSWRHAIIIPLHKKLSVIEGIIEESLCCVLCTRCWSALSWTDSLNEETTRDEQAGFRPGRSTIDQVFIVRRVIEIWQRYSKPTQLTFLDFEAAFDSPHRGRLLNALRVDEYQESSLGCLMTCINEQLLQFEHLRDVQHRLRW